MFVFGAQERDQIIHFVLEFADDSSNEATVHPVGLHHDVGPLHDEIRSELILATS